MNYISYKTSPKRKSINKDDRSTQKKQKKNLQNDQQTISEPLSQFLDASCGITPATFAARRLPEIKSLWRSELFHEWERKNQLKQQKKHKFLKEENVWKSGGKKSCDRHLRRRTGSYNPRRHHRNHNDLSSKLINNMISRKKKPESRRARRKPELLRQLHTNYASKISPSIFWLRTHYWHSKRFHMANLFKWILPLVHTNRGVTPSLRYSVTLQDSTYLTAQPLDIQISCDSNEEYRKALNLLFERMIPQICGPPPLNFTNESFFTGYKTLYYTLYYPNSYPCRPIGPAQFMFRQGLNKDDIKQEHLLKDQNPVNYYSVLTIYVHPSIRIETKEIVDNLISEINNHYNNISETNSEEEETSTQKSTSNITKTPKFSLNNTTSKALLCLRGNHATKCLMKALSPMIQESNENILLSSKRKRIWQNINHQLTLYNNESDVNRKPCCIDDLLMCSEFNHGDTIRILIPQNEMNQDETNLDTSEINNDIHCTLIFKSPNENQSKLNAHVSGWDLLLSPQNASTVFQKLYLHNACTIGLVEECAACLEADPPIPVFPRDYPDTEQGKIYWNTHTDAQINVEKDRKEYIDDWAMLRALWEHEKDRCNQKIKRTKRKMKRKKELEKYDTKITNKKELKNNVVSNRNIWKCMTKLARNDSYIELKDDDENENKNKTIDLSANDYLVVVRGKMHGNPFLQSLYGSANVSPSYQNTKDEEIMKDATHDMKAINCRRPRRRVKDPSQPVIAYPLDSNSMIEQHVSICRNLLQNLSLPALLRCFVIIDGKGKLLPSAKISECNDEEKNDDIANNQPDEMPKNKNANESMGMKDMNKRKKEECMNTSCYDIGYIVAGSFSQGRGRFIGTGFVSASRFLQCIIRACKEKRNLVILNSLMHNQNTHVSKDESRNGMKDGSKGIYLRVYVRNPVPNAMKRKALLTLLF